MKVVIMMSDNSVSFLISKEKRTFREKADARRFWDCFDCLVGNNFVSLRCFCLRKIAEAWKPFKTIHEQFTTFIPKL